MKQGRRRSSQPSSPSSELLRDALAKQHFQFSHPRFGRRNPRLRDPAGSSFLQAALGLLQTALGFLATGRAHAHHQHQS